MYVWLILAVLFAALEGLAVSKNLQRLEYIAKPAVMVCLLLWLYTSTGLRGTPFWFGVGILFSLLGDIFLMLARDRFFFGLVSFLFAHLAYITGFREQILAFNAWSSILLLFIVANGSRLLRRILGELHTRGEKQLVVPIFVYATVISIMLYAAMSTFYNPAWDTNAAALVSLGAFLFWISDLVLAWNKFVAPVRHGRVFNIAIYHLGQIGLIAGVIVQFG